MLKQILIETIGMRILLILWRIIMINECIILGGGKSISEGISLGIKELLKDRFTIAINYAYRHFPHTCLCFGDHDFYVPKIAQKAPGHPDIYEELKKEPLIIYNNHKNDLKEFQLPNTIFVKSGCGYNINPLKLGFFCHVITGIFALSLAQFLLDYEGKIFLCGYDWTRIPENQKPDIHYYSDQEINHKGKHKSSYYQHNNPDNKFRFFKEPKIKIYNVSTISSIENFEKITYPQMFEMLSKEICNQEELRQEIRNKLLPKL